VESLRLSKISETLELIQSKCCRWALDNVKLLKNAEPDIPSELNDREQDNWNALLAISDLAGVEWAEKSRIASISFSEENFNSADSSISIQLLTDIKLFFDDNQATEVSSRDLVRFLNEQEDRPWPEFNYGREITVAGIAKILNLHGIVPKPIRINGHQIRGYKSEWFQDTWDRYLTVPLPY
jgi:hypothetical protein